MRGEAKQRMVRIVLHWAGIQSACPTSRSQPDEYGIYPATILNLLESGAEDLSIASYPASVVRDRMELPIKPDRDEEIAAMLSQRHATYR